MRSIQLLIHSQLNPICVCGGDHLTINVACEPLTKHYCLFLIPSVGDVLSQCSHINTHFSPTILQYKVLTQTSSQIRYYCHYRVVQEVP